jgi:hypothetical protein
MADVSTETAPSEGRKQERRRGADLEEAILDAAWEQLTAEGYGRFTIDTVAVRAAPANRSSTGAGRPATICCERPSVTGAAVTGAPTPVLGRSGATCWPCFATPTAVAVT